MSHRAPFIRALLPILGLTLQACAPEEDTPTPTAAPTPTATPVPDLEPWYQVSKLTVLPDGVGLDLDGNGSVDNALEATLDEIAARLPAQITPGICSDDGCSAEELAVIQSICLTVQAYLTPASLEIALMKPLLSGQEAVYFHFYPDYPGWNLRWSENPAGGDYHSNFTEVAPVSPESTTMLYREMYMNLAAEISVVLPEDTGSSLTLLWTYSPQSNVIQWTDTTPSATVQTLRLGSLLNHAAFMEAFEELTHLTMECQVPPCPDPFRWLYDQLEIVAEQVFSEDLDGNGNETIGMGLDITGQRL